jgi:thioredoxin-dependent peroxiredoxin
MQTTTAQERSDVITFKGKPFTLLGMPLSVGQPAPEFALTAGDLSTATLDTVIDGGKRTALLIVVPSLDTSVCHTETKTFNSRIGELADVATYVVSMDLPMAQARWCGAEGVTKIVALSDYRTHDFGYAYGLRIKELGLLARANIVIGKDKTIKYLEIVPEVTHEPSYDATIAAAKAAG